MMNSQNFIEIDSVSKMYGLGTQQVTALQDVSLSFGKEEFICLLGPSGCGKTTLLNMLAGFELPTTGILRAFGEPVEHPGADRTMMFQDYALFPWLTVEQNIKYGLKRKGCEKKEQQRISEHYVKLIDLVGFEQKYPRQLSGGMRQRVALARALAVQPKMLLMDEPFAALDSFTRERMQDELIRVWQAERKAVVFVTHSINEALKLADKIVVMSSRPGRVSGVIEMDDDRPRDLDSPANIASAKRIRDILHLT
jgi:NitT/TauT family transport system ATP-binding protein